MSKKLRDKESVKKAIYFDRPNYIPMEFWINPACWKHYPQEALLELMESHPFLFPNFQRPMGKVEPEFALVARKDQPYVDDFGCTWETTDDGITGTVTKHPLEDWAAFETYKIPDPSQVMGIGKINWEEVKKGIKARGDMAIAGLRHGHTFLQLCDIRGYQNLLIDMVDGEPRLNQLIEKLECFNTHIVKEYVDAGVDMMCYAEDLGMQNGPMLSPSQFKKYIKPSYQRMMKIARDKDVIIHMHSDGHLHYLVDDLIGGGVEVLNLQDLVNGIPWIKEKLKEKVCIELDIDRQKITPYGTPKQIDELILEEVRELGSKQGGLMMIYGLYPGVPLENVKALMDAMEKYAFYYA